MPIRTMTAAALVALVAAFPSSAFDAVTLADYSGEEIFQRFCSSCHGESGRGDGPVAQSLITKVADLTTISRRYGEFPATLVRDTIDGRGVRVDVHGTREMPVWGYEFWVEEGGDVVAQREMKETIAKLVEYIQSIQTDE